MTPSNRTSYIIATPFLSFCQPLTNLKSSGIKQIAPSTSTKKSFMFQISEKPITIYLPNGEYYENVVKVVLRDVRQYSFLFPDLAHCFCEAIMTEAEDSNLVLPSILLARPIQSVNDELNVLRLIEKRIIRARQIPDYLLFECDFENLDKFLDLLESQGQNHASKQTIVWKFACIVSSLRNPNLY